MHLRYSWTRSMSCCCQRQSSCRDIGGWRERLDRLVDLVVPRDVGHEILDERERAHRLDGDRLLEIEVRQPGLAREAGLDHRPPRCRIRTWRPCSSSGRRDRVPRGPGSSAGRRGRPSPPRPARRSPRSDPRRPGCHGRRADGPQAWIPPPFNGHPGAARAAHRTSGAAAWSRRTWRRHGPGTRRC